MPGKLDISNRRFGRLLALRPTDRRSGRKIVWECLCDCGATAFAAINHLNDGRRVSCGCAKAAGKQIITPKPHSHGHYVKGRPSRTYHSWSAMNTRCKNPNDHGYEHYGARGISICERWESFENFLFDMGLRPEGHTLDRKDVNGNYEPSNCRWASNLEQSKNKRNNRYFEAFGVTQTITDWSRQFNICRKTIKSRLEAGMAFERVILASAPDAALQFQQSPLPA